MRLNRFITIVFALLSLILVAAASAQADPAPDSFLRRCENAGFTAQECRRIYEDLYGEEIDFAERGFAERCLNAGYTRQQCRRIYNALYSDDALAERCRAAGLTVEECRRAAAAAQPTPVPPVRGEVTPEAPATAPPVRGGGAARP